MSDDMTMISKQRYEEYVQAYAELITLKDMVSQAETIEDLISALKVNDVEVSEELCKLAS